MENHDILLKTSDGIFSYRVAGILVQNGAVLVHRPLNAHDYAFPGGHVQFGETGEQTLIREYREEIGADIHPLRLLWVQENFWNWDGRNCHQLAFYYQIEFSGTPSFPLDGAFLSSDFGEKRKVPLEFSWQNLDSLSNLELYPEFAAEKLSNLSDSIEHFVSVDPAFSADNRNT